MSAIAQNAHPAVLGKQDRKPNITMPGDLALEIHRCLPLKVQHRHPTTPGPWRQIPYLDGGGLRDCCIGIRSVKFFDTPLQV